MSYLLGSDAVRSQEQRKRTNLKVNAAGGCSSGNGQATAGGGAQSQNTTQSSTPSQVAPIATKPVWQGAQANRVSHRAERYYEGVWGIGELRIKSAESGQLIRFNYRVLDPTK